MAILKSGRHIQLAGIYSRTTYNHPDWAGLELNGSHESISKGILEYCKAVFGKTAAYHCNIPDDFDLKKNRLPPYFSSFWVVSTGITDGDSSELVVTIFHSKYRVLPSYDDLVGELNELD